MNLNGRWLEHLFERIREDNVDIDADDEPALIHECMQLAEKEAQHTDSSEEGQTIALQRTMVKCFVAGYMYRDDIEDSPSQEATLNDDGTMTIPLRMGPHDVQTALVALMRLLGGGVDA